MSAERRVDGALFGSSVETLRRRRRSKRVWFDASESPEAERSARPFELRVGPSLIADVPRGERVHQRGLDLHAQGDLLPRRAPHAAARREPDGRHAASSRARARRDRARDGDVQRRRRHGLERRGPTSGERKGRSRDGRLRDSLRASSVWRDDARRTRRTRSRGKKAVAGSRKRGHLIHSAPSRGADPRRKVSGNAGDLDFFVRVDIFARFGPDRPRIAIGNADQTLAVNVPPPGTEPVRARSVPAQRTASRRSEGSEGERGCVCRGGRRGAVPPGCRIANGLARRARGASSDRAGRADSGREKAPTNVSPRDRRRPRAALD